MSTLKVGSLVSSGAIGGALCGGGSFFDLDFDLSRNSAGAMPERRYPPAFQTGSSRAMMSSRAGAVCAPAGDPADTAKAAASRPMCHRLRTASRIIDTPRHRAPGCSCAHALRRHQAGDRPAGLLGRASAQLRRSPGVQALATVMRAAIPFLDRVKTLEEIGLALRRRHILVAVETFLEAVGIEIDAAAIGPDIRAATPGNYRRGIAKTDRLRRRQ